MNATREMLDGRAAAAAMSLAMRAEHTVLELVENHDPRELQSTWERERDRLSSAKAA